MGILEKTRSQLEHLSKSERKVTEVILASPDSAIHSSAAALALEANVSESTVSRFCRSMDTRGSPGFELHLVQSLANGTPCVNRSVNKNDSAEPYTGKTFESTMVMLDHIRHSLDKSVIDRAVDLLTQTKKIAFFGLGSSTAVAHDAMSKFSRFNVSMVYSDDIVLQRMSCMNCSDGGVVVLVSHTGRTKNLVELAQLACENDTMVIALTSTGTLLTREATLAITLGVPGDADIYMPMVSRPAWLAVIDTLATRFTLRCDAKFRDSSKRVREVLKESRLDKQLPNSSDDH